MRALIDVNGVRAASASVREGRFSTPVSTPDRSGARRGAVRRRERQAGGRCRLPGHLAPSSRRLRRACTGTGRSCTRSPAVSRRPSVRRVRSDPHGESHDRRRRRLERRRAVPGRVHRQARRDDRGGSPVRAERRLAGALRRRALRRLVVEPGRQSDALADRTRQRQPRRRSRRAPVAGPRGNLEHVSGRVSGRNLPVSAPPAAATPDRARHNRTGSRHRTAESPPRRRSGTPARSARRA